MIAAAMQNLWNLWLLHPIGQTIGIFASLCYIFAALQKHDRRLIAGQLTGTLLFILHYGMLGAWAAMCGYTVGCSRNVIAYFRLATPSRRVWLTIAYFAIYIILAFFVVKRWIDICPLLSGALITIAFLNFTGIRMRVLLLFAQIAFLIYAVWVGSIGGTFSVSCEIIFNSFTIRRLLRADAATPQTP
jgi:hypothetical protein